MAILDRIRSLRDKHAHLDTAISKEASRALPDFSLIGEWKREKLRIKDSISTLEREPAH